MTPATVTPHTVLSVGSQCPMLIQSRDALACVSGGGHFVSPKSRQIAPVVSEVTATSSRAQRVICASSLCNFSGWLEAGRGFFRRASV